MQFSESNTTGRRSVGYEQSKFKVPPTSRNQSKLNYYKVDPTSLNAKAGIETKFDDD